MECDGVWMKVPDGVDPDSPILCAPASFPKRTIVDVDVSMEFFVARAPTCPIKDENPNNSDDDDE